MTNLQTLQAARDLLLDVTPLKADCGRRCGGACCRPDADGQGGMLLFPGEEALYPAPDWADIAWITPFPGSPSQALLTCRGACPRQDRPLACRIFPLTPLATEDGGVDIALDARAWPVCPLMPHGLGGLARPFVDAAREAARLLWADPACRAYLLRLTAHLTDLQSL